MATFSFRLDENNEGDKVLLDVLRSSGDKTALIKDALDALLRRDGDRIKPTYIVDHEIIEAQSQQIAALRAQVNALLDRLMNSQAAETEILAILRVLKTSGGTNAVVVSRDEDGNNLVELPLSEGFIESVKLAAKGRPAMRLDDSGEVIQ